MIKVVAIDDEPLALRQLAAYIREIPFFELTGECRDAAGARQLIEEGRADAVFCDIDMPDLNGMDFVRSLVAPPIVVFATAYSEYAVEGYKVDAADYLLKPFSQDEFRRAAERVRERFVARTARTGLAAAEGMPAPSAATAAAAQPLVEGDQLFVKTDGRIVKVALADIRFIEGMSEYLKLHLKSVPRPVITLLSMKRLEERLPSCFMRIHRSWIINLGEIKEVNKNRVIMDDKTYLPIGDMYREAFMAYIDSRFLGK